MSKRNWLAGGVLVAAFVAAGCGGSSSAPTTPPAKPTGDVKPNGDAKPKDDESKKIADALAKLSPEDRKLAEEQKYCPESGNLLGSMDTPIKVDLKNGKSVFVCCDGCVEDAKKDPEGTLKKLADLKAKEGKK
jgi:Cu(I)/Ag(I) efflux system membrane fusion protein